MLQQPRLNLFLLPVPLHEVANQRQETLQCLLSSARQNQSLYFQAALRLYPHGTSAIPLWYRSSRQFCSYRWAINSSSSLVQSSKAISSAATGVPVISLELLTSRLNIWSWTISGIDMSRSLQAVFLPRSTFSANASIPIGYATP